MKIFIFYATAGHGHKKAAEALHEELKRRGVDRKADVRFLDVLHYMRGVFGRSYSSSYFFLVAHAAWLWAFFYLLSDKLFPLGPMRFLRGCVNSFYGKPLEEFLAKENPDLILTTHFLSAEVASRLRREGKITSKIVVVVTDFLVHRFWVNPGTDFYVGMMRDTKEALLEMGVKENQIGVLGIPVSDRFSMPVEKESLLKSLLLESGRLTALVTSGSFGIGPLKEFIGRLTEFKDSVQVIAVCGTNQTLYEELKSAAYPFPIAVLGFVNNMHELMAVSDILVSRSSGLTTSEALVRGVPLVVASKIPGQESYNAEILEKYHAAFFAGSVGNMVRLVGEILKDPERLRRVRANMLKLAKPRAAQDIADLALGLLEKK